MHLFHQSPGCCFLPPHRGVLQRRRDGEGKNLLQPTPGPRYQKHPPAGAQASSWWHWCPFSEPWLDETDQCCAFLSWPHQDVPVGNAAALPVVAVAGSLAAAGLWGAGRWRLLRLLKFLASDRCQYFAHFCRIDMFSKIQHDCRFIKLNLRLRKIALMIEVQHLVNVIFSSKMDASQVLNQNSKVRNTVLQATRFCDGFTKGIK